MNFTRKFRDLREMASAYKCKLYKKKKKSYAAKSSNKWEIGKFDMYFNNAGLMAKSSKTTLHQILYVTPANFESIRSYFQSLQRTRTFIYVAG